MKLFVFVIASFNEPVYIEMIRLRKLQLKQNNIPHYFVFDDVPPDGYILDDNDLLFEKEISTHPPGPINPNMNPHMIIKFLKGLSKINEFNYDVILRVNISTYVNFARLLHHLQDKQRPYAMGHFMRQSCPYFLECFKNKDLTVLSGTCMIFSPEVIAYLKTVNIHDKLLTVMNDDTVLSHIIHEKIKPNIYELNTKWVETEPNYSDIDDSNNCVFRIKSGKDRLSHDIYLWKLLLQKIDRI